MLQIFAQNMVPYLQPFYCIVYLLEICHTYEIFENYSFFHFSSRKRDNIENEILEDRFLIRKSKSIFAVME